MTLLLCTTHSHFGSLHSRITLVCTCMCTSASVNLYEYQVESDGRGAVNLGFEDEGDSAKWKKNGENRRRSSSKKALNGGEGFSYEGTSVDNDFFGEKLREESIVVIQVNNLLLIPAYLLQPSLDASIHAAVKQTLATFCSVVRLCEFRVRPPPPRPQMRDSRNISIALHWSTLQLILYKKTECAQLFLAEHL